MTVSPYRLVLNEDHEAEKPWILEIWLGEEFMGTMRFETDGERNDAMRLFQEPGEYNR